MGNDRKSRHARMGLLIDERTCKRMPDLQTRRMPMLGENIRATPTRGVVRHGKVDRALIPKITFKVDVVFDNEENVWVASCDALGIVTEAKTFEALTQRVQDLVPEMIEANQILLGGRKPYLKFSHLEEAVI